MPEDKRSGKPPRRRVARVLLLAALLLLASYTVVAFARSRVGTLTAEPPRAPSQPLPAPLPNVVTGVLSVHTERSHDAVGTVEEVSRAAHDAGLDFVVVGDHPPSDTVRGTTVWPSSYENGVLVVQGLELRVWDVGRILVMGLDTTVFVWGQGPASLMDLLRDRDATAFVVHGRSSRRGERWQLDHAQGVAGWEVLDVSEAARRRLAEPWAAYHITALLASSVLGRMEESLLRLNREGFEVPSVKAFDSLRAAEPITAVAGLNHHPKTRIGPILLPAYGPAFRTFVNHVAMDAPLPPDPHRAREALAGALARGRVFISCGSAATAEGFRFAATWNGQLRAEMGEVVPYMPGMTLRAGFPTSPRAHLAYRVLQNGTEVARIQGPDLEWALPGPGLFRVEVYSYAARLGSLSLDLQPWIFTNPIELTSEATR